MEKNRLQQFRAGKWLAVIQEYFRDGISSPRIAGGHNLRKEQVDRIVRDIRNAAKGKRYDGGFRRKLRSRDKSTKELNYQELTKGCRI